MDSGMGWYFVALPDLDEAQRISDLFDAGTHRVVTYPSGRPMLVARTHDDQFVAAEAGRVRGAVIGASSATADGLRSRFGRSGDVRELDSYSQSLAGSYHFVATDGDRLRVQGTASGLRRVFHAVIGGFPVASDRADLLAWLGGFAYDERALAMRLLGVLPHPLPEEPLWKGVAAVPPEEYLLLDKSGARTSLWWRRPEPVLSRVDGATGLRAALTDAVSVRTRAGGTVHCDLSGGLDSTPLCYLAAQGPAEVLANTAYNEDPGGREDLLWARRALPSMPRVRHTTSSTDDMPQFFEGVESITERLDAPTQAYLTAPRIRHSIEAALGGGARLYLNGLGGDHLLHGLPVWDHGIFRRRPWLAWRRARTNAMLTNRPLWRVGRELLNSESYRDWLLRMIGGARQDRHEESAITLGWDLPFMLPRWLSKDAIAAVTARMRQIGADAVPLGPDRARHAELAIVRDGCRIVRGTQQYAATMGMPFEAPFFDDRVVEACFAVRHEERDTPMEFKPLIKEAMRGALPGEFLARGSKASGSPQAARGLRDHWRTLLPLCEQSPLVGLGIVDFAALANSESPEHMGVRDSLFDYTVNCAVFLRNQVPAPAALA
ncbi:asparagine synthase (glutamine-hydrolysing) [Amycolatopsis xylanica]|uniref:Asparagine synthase (Glutamine-hydrolysing) n=1 Tax=Amycolatopsis xylanica TaxID=589385 RepID=A0A1H3SEQ6_9PSEU|nr:asparagine synthase (glutamine-hydrolysing) [Amycolatopsis xylanica]